MKVIKIEDLYRIYKNTTFELYIKKRTVLNKGYSKLQVILNSVSYEMWEPKNTIWKTFSPRVGMGLICKIEVSKDYKYIKPIEQLLVLDSAYTVLDLHDLPYINGSTITLNIGVVSTHNKTQYLIVSNKEFGNYLIRTPANWEIDINKIQYKQITVVYKRTECKGFLSLLSIDRNITQEEKNILFNK